jgi:hypothetical protein
MISIYAAAVLSKAHEDVIGPKSFPAATESPPAEKWNTLMNKELDAIGSHEVFGDFVKLLEGRKALQSYWVYKIKHDGTRKVKLYKARPVCG